MMIGGSILKPFFSTVSLVRFAEPRRSIAVAITRSLLECLGASCVRFLASARPSLSRNRRNTFSSVDEVGLRPNVPLNDKRLDDLASVRILDGIHRRAFPVWGVAHPPSAPVRRHQFGNFFAHLGTFGEPFVLLSATACAAGRRRSASILSGDWISLAR